MAITVSNTVMSISMIAQGSAGTCRSGQGHGDRCLSQRNGDVMAARSVDSADRRVPRAHELAHPPIQHSLRPRLAVLAPSVVEVVRSAGGWLFDRAMAGWNVTVITSDHSDSRPLQILGADRK